MSENTPTLADLIDQSLTSRLQGLHTAIPARVESYDPVTISVSAKPLIKRFFEDENGAQKPESLPVVNRVPVVFPGGGGFGDVYPLAKGDVVLLIASESSLDKWLSRVGAPEVEPSHDHRHSLSDAIAIPGLGTLIGRVPTLPGTQTIGHRTGLGKIDFTSLLTQIGGTGGEPLIKGATFSVPYTALAAALTAISIPGGPWITFVGACTGPSPTEKTAMTGAIGAIQTAAVAITAALALMLSPVATTK